SRGMSSVPGGYAVGSSRSAIAAALVGPLVLGGEGVPAGPNVGLVDTVRGECRGEGIRGLCGLGGGLGRRRSENGHTQLDRGGVRGHRHGADPRHAEAVAFAHGGRVIPLREDTTLPFTTRTPSAASSSA